jgi:hypothetical protein
MLFYNYKIFQKSEKQRIPFFIKVWILSGILLSLRLIVYTQFTPIKEGGYRNIGDFHKGKTIIDSVYTFEKSNYKKIPNFYKVEFLESFEDTNDMPLNSIFLIYENNYLYINASRLGMKDGFIRVEKVEKFIYFKGTPVRSLEQKYRVNQSIFLFGAGGGVISNMNVDIENKDKIHYVLNMESGMVNLLTVDYLRMILEPYPELLFNFNIEASVESLETKLKYLNLINSGTNYLSKMNISE